ncbi:DUF4442 domain-containing protein [Thalassotalea ganghwensis]
MSNRLSKMVAKINRLPSSIKPWLLTKLFCSQVKYANTTGIRIERIDDNGVEITLANRKKVQNHIGGVHAVAAALLAESATGIAFGIHVPDSQLPLLKSMTINYKRRMQGNLKAVAFLEPQQRELIKTQDKGELAVNVVITDESGEEPIECYMTWAWITKTR